LHVEYISLPQRWLVSRRSEAVEFHTILVLFIYIFFIYLSFTAGAFYKKEKLGI